MQRLRGTALAALDLGLIEPKCPHTQWLTLLTPVPVTSLASGTTDIYTGKILIHI